MNISSKELTNSISDERIEELGACFWDESNEEWTQEWRDDLNPAEAALIAEWDRSYDNGIDRILCAIFTSSGRRALPS